MKVRVIETEDKFFHSIGEYNADVIILYHKEQDKDLLLNALKSHQKPNPNIDNPLFQGCPVYMGRMVRTLKSNFMTDFLLPKDEDIAILWKKVKDISKEELTEMFETINKLKERN